MRLRVRDTPGSKRRGWPGTGPRNGERCFVGARLPLGGHGEVLELNDVGCTTVRMHRAPPNCPL